MLSLSIPSLTCGSSLTYIIVCISFQSITTCVSFLHHHYLCISFSSQSYCVIFIIHPTGVSLISLNTGYLFLIHHYCDLFLIITTCVSLSHPSLLVYLFLIHHYLCISFSSITTCVSISHPSLLVYLFLIYHYLCSASLVFTILFANLLFLLYQGSQVVIQFEGKTVSTKSISETIRQQRFTTSCSRNS